MKIILLAFLMLGSRFIADLFNGDYHQEFMQLMLIVLYLKEEK